MKILMLTRYGRLGASSRMRSGQYLPWLDEKGIEVTSAPMFSDLYVQDLQQNKRKLFEVLHAYVNRIRTLLSTQRFDLVWIEKEALPWLPVWLEQLLLSTSVPYVLDYDDAVFHYYDQHRNLFIRLMLGSKHPALIRQAALVVAGNSYLADFALAAGAKRVKLIPTVIDLARYPLPPLVSKRTDGPPCVGWIGQRATAEFLEPYVSLFRHCSENGHARFAAIGIDAVSLGLPMASIPWTEETEVASIGDFDIGIMPLVDAPFERGKCGYKLIQYMACGLPIVASPVGVNCQIVEHGINGFLAETPQQWKQALTKLLVDPALRQHMGRAGRKKVEESYCIQKTGPQLADLLQDVVIAHRKINNKCAE